MLNDDILIVCNFQLHLLLAHHSNHKYNGRTQKSTVTWKTAHEHIVAYSFWELERHQFCDVCCSWVSSTGELFLEQNTSSTKYYYNVQTTNTIKSYRHLICNLWTHFSHSLCSYKQFSCGHKKQLNGNLKSIMCPFCDAYCSWASRLPCHRTYLFSATKDRQHALPVITNPPMAPW